jgi:hypothetical protein
MTIELKEYPHPNLKVAKMNCDGDLHEKLNKYPFTKLFNKHQSTLICGKAGQGKTSLLYGLFSSNKLLKKVYNTIILFQPNSSRDSMEHKLFDVLPEEQLFNELNEETLEQAVEIVDRTSGEDGNSVIIFDDVTASLKDNEIEKELKRLNWNKRHKKLSFFFLSQSYYAVVKDVRKMFNYVIVFKVSPSELKVIIDENLQGNYDKKKINEISNIVFDEKYNYLVIDSEAGRLYKGNKSSFNELVFDDN